MKEKFSDNVATAIFRVVIGILGLFVVWLLVTKGFENPMATVSGGFVGVLFLAYALGGNARAMRFFNFLYRLGND